MRQQFCGCGCGHRPLVGDYLPGHNSIAHYAKVNKAAVFWSHVTRGAPDECWLWSGATTNYGYGVMRWKGQNVGAHRIAWELTHGPIPGGMSVLHECDRTCCTNPAHLKLGSQSDNMRDAAIRNRMPKDMTHTKSTPLTWRGETHSVSEWARKVGIGIYTLHQRFRYGWTVDRALSTPAQQYRRKKQP